MDKYIDFNGFKKLCERIVNKTAKKASLDEHIGNKSNPHGVTKSQVGLGNVPNVTTNNQTPTYTTVETLAKLVTGEKLGVAFGKIAKAVDELIAHLSDTSGNKHIPAGGSSGQILRWSADGTAEWGNDNNTTYTPASAAPKAPGTAAVGTSTKYAREDHVHPSQTSVSGNAGTATKLAAAKTVDGMSFDGSGNITHYILCGTAAATAAKTTTKEGFVLSEGAELIVKFSYTNTAATPTLNVQSTGAKQIRYKGAALPFAGILDNARYHHFYYDGTYWELVGDYSLGISTTTFEATTTTVTSTVTKTLASGKSLYNRCLVHFDNLSYSSGTVSIVGAGNTPANYIITQGQTINLQTNPAMSLSYVNGTLSITFTVGSGSIAAISLAEPQAASSSSKCSYLGFAVFYNE